MRKKIFATLMSVAMVASFMPSMAFAAAPVHTHDYTAVTGVNDGTTEVAYDVVKTAMNNAATNPYVELVKAPTCDEDGVALITCKAKGCKEDYIGHTKKVKVTKLNHSNTYLKEVTVDEAKAFLAKQASESTTTAATWAKSDSVVNACKIKATYCTDCNKIVGFNKTTGVIAHQPLKDKTCNGKTICKVCGKEVACTKEGAHTFTSGKTVEVAATCDAPAKIKKVCDVCGEAVDEDAVDIPGTKAKGHNFGTPVSKAEACVANTTTLNKGYFAITDVAGTENGFAVTKTQYYKSNAVVNGTDCKNFAALQCQDCKKYVNFTTDHTVKSDNIAMVAKTAFTPADASNAWEMAAAHDYVATEVPATCTENAKTVKVCKNCGTKEEIAKLNTKLGHDYKVKETPVDGNCVNGVTYTVVCTRCKTHGEAQFATTTDKDGTRYFTGFAGETALTPGNYIKVPANKTSADHKLGKQEKIADATCEHGELHAQKCTVCHKVDPTTIVEVSKAKDHTLEEVVTPETCQNTKKVETKCKVCGKVVKTVGGLEKADKKDCVYNAWKVVKNPTLFEEGMKKSACSVCGKIEENGSSIAIAKLTLAKPEVKLISKKGKLTVKATSASATGYTVTYKRAGKAAVTKTYTAESIRKTFKLLKGKKYTVKVTAFASNGTDTVESDVVTKSIKIKK